MSDMLLITWELIHENLFVDWRGKPIISLSTLQQKYGPGLKASGVVFKYLHGHKKTNTIAGWQSKIMGHFIKLGQLEDAERVKRKADKKRNKDLSD